MSQIPPSAERRLLPRAHDQATWIWFLGSAIALLLAVVVMSPLVQDPVQYPEGWVHTLSELYRTPARFGSDVQFTFGPWGFIFGGYHPKTFAITCSFWLVVSLLSWSVGRRAFDPSRTGWSSVKAATLFVGWTLLLGGRCGAYSDSRMALLSFALVLNHFYLARRRVDWLTLALAITLGFAGTSKLTYLAAGGIAIGAVTFEQLLNRRLLAWPGAAAIAAFVLAWLVGGQALNDLPAYFKTSIEVIRGYDAMALHTRFDQFEVLGFLCCAASLLLLVVLRPVKPGTWVAASTFGLLTFLLFRSSYVRHDAHSAIGSGLVCMFVPLLAVTRWANWSTQSRNLAIVAICGCLLVNAEEGLRYGAKTVPFSPLYAARNVVSFARQLVDCSRGRPSDAAKAYTQTMVELRDSEPLPPMTGSVDLIPNQTDLVLANGYHFTPRPTLQSYAAYTPTLARANADFFAGPHKPDNVLFRVAAMDLRLPSLEENLSWLELLKRYQLAGVFGHYLQLVPRATPRSMSLTEFDHTTAELNHPFPIPTPPHGGLLWAQIQISPRTLGKLAGQIYKPPQIYLAVTLNGGQTAKHRLITANAAEGFLLGPYVESNTTFIDTLADPRVTDAIKPCMPSNAAVVTSPGFWPRFYLKPTVEIRFFELTFTEPKT